MTDNIKALADAITAPHVMGGCDAYGNHIASLTEAVIGITDGLKDIAEAIHDLAAAMREQT